MAKELGFVLKVDGIAPVITDFGRLEAAIGTSIKAVAEFKKQLNQLKDAKGAADLIKEYSKAVENLEENIAGLENEDGAIVERRHQGVGHGGVSWVSGRSGSVSRRGPSP